MSAVRLAACVSRESRQIVLVSTDNLSGLVESMHPTLIDSLVLESSLLGLMHLSSRFRTALCCAGCCAQLQIMTAVAVRRCSLLWSSAASSGLIIPTEGL